MHIPQRMCIGCRKMMPKNELIKVVLKDGNVQVDPEGKKQGRGAYFCRDLKCIEAARKKKALSRQFKTNVPEEVYTEVKGCLDG